MFKETGPDIVVLGPLLYPLAQKIGTGPVHFRVFMITTLGHHRFRAADIVVRAGSLAPFTGAANGHHLSQESRQDRRD